MSNDKPNFINIDPEADEQLLINKYLELTKKTEIFPAQSERILISLIAYYANLVKNQFNDAAALNLVRYSRAPILDFIGELFGCTRLPSRCGEDTLQIELFEAFTSDLTIDKGLEVQSKDGEYIFKTSEDATIPAGEVVVTVPLESAKACSAVNTYGAGDINTLIKPLSYIKTVTNLNGVSGGLDEESDDAYIERILLSPESYTCAGSYGAYIYHAKSAHQDIVDVEAESPQLPAEIKINGEVFEDFEVDYKTGKLTFTYNGVNEASSLDDGTTPPVVKELIFEITIPPAASVFIYPLIKEGGASFDIVKAAVEAKLNDRDCMPMTDYINVVESSGIEKKLNITVTLEAKADKDLVKTNVNKALEEFCRNHRNTLNSSLIPLRLNTLIGNIEGVWDVDLGDLKNIETAKINEFFDITANVSYKEQK